MSNYPDTDQPSIETTVLARPEVPHGTQIRIDIDGEIIDIAAIDALEFALDILEIVDPDQSALDRLTEFRIGLGPVLDRYSKQAKLQDLDVVPRETLALALRAIERSAIEEGAK